jgi:hypothetical protein
LGAAPDALPKLARLRLVQIADQPPGRSSSYQRNVDIQQDERRAKGTIKTVRLLLKFERSHLVGYISKA